MHTKLAPGPPSIILPIFRRTTRETLHRYFLSEPYQRRVALVGARVFEDMKGFEGDLGVQLGRILRGAVQDGLNPRAMLLAN